MEMKNSIVDRCTFSSWRISNSEINLIAWKSMNNSSFENYESHWFNLEKHSRPSFSRTWLWTITVDMLITLSSQAQIINGHNWKNHQSLLCIIETCPSDCMSRTEYSVQAFDSIDARTRTTADGNCLYSSLSILKYWIWKTNPFDEVVSCICHDQ